ncbi:MAG TPA: VWA domain-containing protein [Candidatus Dormibacteraeota bacterium]|nr:VWA domain-containing protein [Candidatus Dormibacteraeota bacterium]
MEPYAQAYLQLLHCAAHTARAEAFTFATRLTRLTRLLRSATPAAALERAGRAAPDWSGGTRIGPALQAFLDRYGRRGLAHGAVVLVVSDGWERGDAALVGVQMARLARLAHRVVWVNPRKAAEDFQPLAGGMAAALPYCDAFVSGHSLEAMAEVAKALAPDRSARSAPGA